MLENRFREQEWYGSAAATWQPASFMTWSLATDIYHTKLRRSGEFIGDSSNPTRNSWLTNLGLLLRFRKVSLQSGLLATQVSDRISRVNTAEAIHRITPPLPCNINHPTAFRCVSVFFIRKYSACPLSTTCTIRSWKREPAT